MRARELGSEESTGARSNNGASVLGTKEGAVAGTSNMFIANFASGVRPAQRHGRGSQPRHAVREESHMKIHVFPVQPLQRTPTSERGRLQQTASTRGSGISSETAVSPTFVRILGVGRISQRTTRVATKGTEQDPGASLEGRACNERGRSLPGRPQKHQPWPARDSHKTGGTDLVAGRIPSGPP